MPKVYTKIPGLELRIDFYGTATETVSVEVPADVAQALKRDGRLRVVLDVDLEKVTDKVAKALPRRRAAPDAEAVTKEKEG